MLLCLFLCGTGGLIGSICLYSVSIASAWRVKAYDVRRVNILLKRVKGHRRAYDVI